MAAQVRDHYLSTLGAALALVLPPAGSLHLRRVLEPSAAGLAALAAGEPGAEALEHYLGGGGADGAAARLRRRGWLAAAYHLHVAGERPTPRLLAVGEGRPARLGTRQRAALDYARRHRTVDEVTLRRRSGLSARGLARLVADDVLTVAGEGARRRAGEPVPTLLAEQEAALSEILAATGRGESVLLHGVTGSGKTEVYLRAAEAVLRSGHGVLVLVPEIGLTGQTVARLAARFPGERIAVFHSGLSSGERLAAWRDTAAGRARLVLGARSAVFAPIRRPRPDRRRRRARLLVQARQRPALRRPHGGRLARAPHRRRAGAGFGHAECRGLRHHGPPRRPVATRRRFVAAAPRDRRPARHSRLAVAQLSRAMTQAVEAGDKVILFLNRRGYASLLACNHCGHTWICPHCDVALAYFARGDRLRCRICDYHEPAPGRVSRLSERRARPFRLRHRGSRARGGRPAARHRAAAARFRRSGVVLTPGERARALRRSRRQGAGRHADDRQGSPLSRGHAGGRRQRRPHAAVSRLSRRGAHLRHARPGRRPQRPRRASGTRARADPRPRGAAHRSRGQRRARALLPRRTGAPGGARLPAGQHAARGRGVVGRGRQGDSRRRPSWPTV